MFIWRTVPSAQARYAAKFGGVKLRGLCIGPWFFGWARFDTKSTVEANPTPAREGDVWD